MSRQPMGQQVRELQQQVERLVADKADHQRRVEQAFLRGMAANPHRQMTDEIQASLSFGIAEAITADEHLRRGDVGGMAAVIGEYLCAVNDPKES